MKIVRRAWFWTLMVVLCMGLAACGREDDGGMTVASELTSVSATQQVDTTAEVVEEKIRVCVMYDEESLYANRDMCVTRTEQAAAEFDVELVSMSWNLDNEGKEDFLAACDEGYDLMIGTTAGFADWIAAYAEEYPETDFMVLDAVVEASNVKSVSFSQKEGYFLAGAAAAVIAGSAESETEGTGNEESAEDVAVIGWVNNIDIPIFQEWFAAYEQGAKYVNSEIQVLWNVSGQWEDLDAGKTWISEQMEQGAAAVMYVPFDIEESGTEAMAGNRLLTAELQEESELASVVWTPEETVCAAIRDVSLGKFAAGYTETYSLLDGAVKLDLPESLEEICGDALAADIRTVCEELTEKICVGEILVSGVRAEETAATESDAVPSA